MLVQISCAGFIISNCLFGKTNQHAKGTYLETFTLLIVWNNFLRITFKVSDDLTE